MIYLSLTAGKIPTVGDVFNGFAIFGKAWWLSFITSLFTMLWTLLLFIPGIIKGISYSMAPYVLAENPEMTARQALNESKWITNGSKMDLFVLDLSFLGWILLGIASFGIAFIYIGPYISATRANAYLSIKEKNA